jgi:hypothetical protein
MQAEVVAYCEAKGWREDKIPFSDAMALMHTEIAEASDAWRRWGLEDRTYHVSDGKYLDRWGKVRNSSGGPPKPEGVGSEFADILIRLLDDCDQFDVGLQAAIDRNPGRFGINESFLANMNALHTMVAKASDVTEFAWDEADPGAALAREFAAIYVFLGQLCEHYGVDLMAEYERKMHFNRTRPYKHGGKAR